MNLGSFGVAWALAMREANSFLGENGNFGAAPVFHASRLVVERRTCRKFYVENLEPSLQIAADIEIVFSCFLFKIN